MKGFLLFLLGMLTMFLLLLFVFKEPVPNILPETEEQYEEENDMDGLTFFPEGKEEIFEFTNKQLNVLNCFQQKNIALVESFPVDKERNVMLLMGSEGDLYYDNLKIDISNEKVLTQIGIYQYENDDGKLKTVPIVRIKDSPVKNIPIKEIPNKKKNKK